MLHALATNREAEGVRARIREHLEVSKKLQQLADGSDSGAGRIEVRLLQGGRFCTQCGSKMRTK